MKNTIIIAAFGCLGKTTFANKYPTLSLDLESSIYQYKGLFEVRDIEKQKGRKDRVLDEDFPDNYVKKIIENIGQYKYIFIVLSREVLHKLDKLGIDYTILYPSLTRKSKILREANQRGNGQEYLKRLDKILSTKDDLDSLKKDFNHKKIVTLKDEDYVEDYIKTLDTSLPKLDLPLFTGGFEHHGQFFKTEFFGFKNKEKTPTLPWAQVYVIGNYKGKVPVVKYKHSRDNLPGGGLYAGESIEDALRREIKEEINMAVLSWEPLGYQKVSDEVGNIGYQLRVYAELQKIGAFTKDPGGSVIGYKLIPIEDLNKYINYGEIGDWLVKSVSDRYGKKK